MVHEVHPDGDGYVDPIAQRYASRGMNRLFSPLRKARTWRDLWIALAEAQHELGLSVTREQIDELQQHRDDIDLPHIAEHERRLRHDVMAHIHGYGDVAPTARPIIHLGATSCFVTDNCDLIVMREALVRVDERLLRMIHALAAFARKEADRPTLGLTHLQPAQLTTVGKRATMWLQDLVLARETLAELRRELPFRGVKGPTGTQASFLQLFGGDADKVRELDRRVADKMGFTKLFLVTGQTYSRLWDYRVLARLSELAIALHKFSTDLRLLQSWGELEEPYEKEQIGSSSMPHKRNPMRAERMSSLSKLLLGLAPSMGSMAATQWCERTLDDSALRRSVIPQAFLCTDALLLIGRNICERMHVNPVVVRRRIDEQLPFLAAEELIMHGVAGGGDRQDLHERLRQLAWRAAETVREGRGNPLRELLEADEVLGPLLDALPEWAPERFVGLASLQTRDFLDQVVAPLPVPEDDGESELSV